MPVESTKSSQLASDGESTDETSAQGARRSTWSVVVHAQGEGPSAQAALGELIKRYERTVAGMVRSFGHPWNSTPDDLKQEFFLGLIRRGDIHKLDRDRGGRFRDWLSVAVKNFMRNEWAAWLADKRGNRLTAPLPAHPMHEITPEHLFLRQFAEDTVLHAFERHRAETKDKARFDLWAQVLPGPQLDLPELGELATRLGMTRNAAAVHTHRLRSRHRRFLAEAVADTLAVDPNDAEGARATEREMAELYRLLCDLPPTRSVLEDA